MFERKWIIIAVIVFFLTPGAVFAAEKVKLSSLEWPPYTGEGLPEGGASIKVAKAAFAAMGYELEVEFYPFQRAVDMAKQGQTAGYFPEYHSADIEKDFIFSSRMGDSPLGLIEPAGAGTTWASLNDLKAKTIGVVSGYVNTAEFDAMAASGALTTDQSPEDATLVRKVAAGRVDMAVIDRHVFDHLLANDPELSSAKAAVSFNPKLLEDKGLFICFTRTPEGEKLAAIFNEGLTKIDANAIMNEYFTK